MGYDFYRNYVKTGWEKNFARIYSPVQVNLGLDEIFEMFDANLPSPEDEPYLHDTLLDDEFEHVIENKPDAIIKKRPKRDLIFYDGLTEEQAAKMVPEYMKKNLIHLLPELGDLLGDIFVEPIGGSIYIADDGVPFDPQQKPEKGSISVCGDIFDAEF